MSHLNGSELLQHEEYLWSGNGHADERIRQALSTDIYKSANVKLFLSSRILYLLVHLVPDLLTSS
jgi:hypothetical protein